MNTSNLSINHLINQQKEKASTTPDNLPRNPFDKDDLIRLWKTTAHSEKLKGQDQVYHVMVKRELQQIDEVRFHFEVDNAIQKTRMDSAISDILAQLRQGLQNFDLEITIDVTKEDVEQTEFLTGTAKFEKMAKKNSNLFDFKNRFNLDIDY